MRVCRFRVLVWLLLATAAAAAAAGCDAPAPGGRIPIYEEPAVALLGHDVQRDFLEPRGRRPVAPAHAAAALTAVNRLIEGARPLRVHVACARSRFRRDDRLGNWLRGGAAIDGDPGAELDERLRLLGAPVFDREGGDALASVALDRWLRDRSVDHLVLAGAVDSAVAATATAARRRGFKVLVVRDAVAAASDGRRARVLARLWRAGAELADSDGVLAQWVRRNRYLRSR